MSEQPKRPFDGEEDEDRDELEEFLFFKKLEENGGRPTKGMMMGGCFFILPLAALLAGAIYLLLRWMY